LTKTIDINDVLLCIITLIFKYLPSQWMMMVMADDIWLLVVMVMTIIMFLWVICCDTDAR
jgi:ABC-type transport system involved in multi-copper enzyme maturation permease subunit